MRLPVRVYPDPREGVWGWALRAAEANHYRNAATVLSMVGYLAPIRPRAEVVANLAEAAGVTGDYFEPLVAPQRGSGFVRLSIRGIDPPRGFLDVSSARVCQICLKEAQIIPAAWDFAFWNACPCHGVKLLLNCPQCGQAITWNRPHLDRCGNRRCLFVFSQGLSAEASDAELTLPIFVARAIGIEALSTKHNLNEFFQNPTATQALNIIHCVGFISKSSTGHKSVSPKQTLENAARALTDWPNQFNILVEAMSHSSELNESNQIFRAFNQMTSQGRISSEHASILRDAVFLAAGRGPTRGPSSASAQKIATGPQKFVTQIAAARLLNISHRVVRKLFHNGQLGGYVKTGKTGNDYLFIDMEDLLKEKARRAKIANLHSKRSAYLSIVEIYKIFGILPRFLNDFENCGLISKSPHHQGALYVKQSVVDLFQSLAKKCQISAKSNLIDHKSITLKKVCRRFDVPLIEVVQSILRSELKPEWHYLDKIGLDSIALIRSDIIEFSKRYRASLGGIQRRHAAHFVGVQKVEMKYLIDSGFLTELEVNSSRPFKYIKVSSVREFKQNHVPTVFISRLLRTRGDALERSFRQKDITPSIPRAASDSTAYWSWSDLKSKFPEAKSWHKIYLDHSDFV